MATGEIKRVWTTPPARGMGIARRMVRTLEATARDYGLKTLRLDTNKALKELRGLDLDHLMKQVELLNALSPAANPEKEVVASNQNVA